jgi:hypothetical protein
MPKVVDEINQGVERIKITQRLPPHPVKKSSAKLADDKVTVA